MQELEVGTGTAFLAIFLVFMGVISVFFSGNPPISPVTKGDGPPAEIQILTTSGAMISEIWVETSYNRTTRIYFRLFHSGAYPQVVRIEGLGVTASNCIIHANPQLSWVMQGQTYQDVEVAATPMSALGVGEFRIGIFTDYESE